MKLLTKDILVFIAVILLWSCGSSKIYSYRKEINKFRVEYKKDFLKEERSPLKRNDLKDLDFFPIDTNFRVKASFKLFNDADTLDFKTSSGKIKQFTPYAVLFFEIKSIPCSLYAYNSLQLSGDAKYVNYLFLPFTDITNENETYGGGRYIDLDKRDFNFGSIILDFNKAYNPWCAFGEGFNCPIPPRENELNLEIRAGEKKFRRLKPGR